MKTKENKIVFVHRSGSGQRIVVENQESANALEQALNAIHDRQWIRVAPFSGPDEGCEFLARKEFKVILVCGSSSFRTASSRVSNTALMLKSKVPATFIGRECLVYISNASANDHIELSCTVNMDQSGKTILEFNRVKTAEIKRLEAWI